MSAIYRIAYQELRSMFYSPIAWLLLIVFLIQSSMVIFDGIYGRLYSQTLGITTFASLTERVFNYPYQALDQIGETIFLYIPLITMGLIAREKSSGSIKLLLSSPIRIADIVLGKFFAIVVFCFMMAMVLVLISFASSFAIQSMDFGAALTGIFGIFLLACTYAAVGLFMSCLHDNQVVVAIGTLAVLTVLAFIDQVLQTVPVIGDITYWLSQTRRFENFRDGLFISRNFFYFLAFTGMMLMFTVLKLSSGRKHESLVKCSSKYGAVALLALVIGYVTSLPNLTFYADGTRVKSVSLAGESLDVIDRIKGPWSITAYINVLDFFQYLGKPGSERVTQDWFGKYTRYNPELTVNYVYYYAQPGDEDYSYTNADSEESLESQVKRIAAQNNIDFDKVLTLAEVNDFIGGRGIDLESVNYRFAYELNWQGKSALLRIYDDPQAVPAEPEITAAFKTILDGVYKVGVVVGHGEASAFKTGGQDIQISLTDPVFRGAMVSHGFSINEVSLAGPVARDIEILVIASPKEKYSDTEQAHLNDYIARGGNLFIGGEPGLEDVINPLMSSVGVRLLPGRLYQPDKDGAMEYTSGGYSQAAIEHGFTTGETDFEKPVKMELATVVEQLPSSEFSATNILSTANKGVWYYEDASTSFSQEKLQAQAKEVASLPVAMALSRKVNDKEQRILVTSDVSFMSNAAFTLKEVGNYNFTRNIFSWLSQGNYPPVIERKAFPDKKILISNSDLNWFKVLFYGLIPLLATMGAATLLLSRRRA